MVDSRMQLFAQAPSQCERVHVAGIRCLAEPQSARLGKITALVGENSTGKSTFLAATSMLDRLLHPKTIRFNREPFILGSYHDIATINPKIGGNVQEFSIGLEGQVQPRKISSYIGQYEDVLSILDLSDELKPYRVDTTFVSKSGQPRASHTNIRIGEDSFRLNWLIDSPNNIQSISIGTETVELTDFSRRHLHFLLDETLIFDISPNAMDEIFGKELPSSFTTKAVNELSKYYLSIKSVVHGQKAYAFAPIRSVPKRTYDPVQGLPAPEGRHIPMRLSRDFRENQQEWQRIRRKLQAFGERSGLFREISVRLLGESASDPFQLTVRVKDEAVNLLDAGYGVSQILPIIVDTLTQPSASLFLLQQPEAHLHPRGQAALATFLLEHVQDSHQRFIVETHSDQIIDRIRIEIRNRQLDPKIFSLLYFEQREHGVSIREIELDSQGNLTNAPSSYRDFFLNEEYSLLGIPR